MEPSRRRVVQCLGSMALAGCGWGTDPVPIRRELSHGASWVHVPARVRRARPLVVCHGMVVEGTADEAARALLEVWRPFADTEGVVVVAPVFGDDFASGTPGALGGYRSLVGRKVPADEYLDEVLDDLRVIRPDLQRSFYLIGHSAGGQFANRYLMRHPERVAAAVVSSPAWFAFPDPAERWPHGMAERHGRFPWGEGGEEVAVDVVPDPQGWVRASRVPTLVVVGAQDTAPLREGSDVNHVTQARSWVEQMRALDANSQVELLVVPEVGHNQGQLARASMPFLRGQR